MGVARLGFLGRVIGIVLMLLLALVALGVGLWFVTQDRATPAAQFPLPRQIAAIVELLDAAPERLHPQIVAAATSPDLAVSLQPRIPDGLQPEQRMPALEWLISQYLETRRDRLVIAARVPLEEMGTVAQFLDRISPTTRTQVTIAVALANGQFVIATLQRASPLRVFAIPVGFWIGLFGFLFAALALWAIAREARPLRQLASSVEAFGIDGQPRRVAPGGALEIQALTTAVNNMQDRIAVLIKARAVLMGGISHDLKTFITRLRLRVEGLDDASQRARAEADLESMTKLIDEALALARGANQPGRRAAVDVHSLIEATLSSRADKDRVVLRSQGEPFLVQGDALGLARLCDNLVDNALSFADRCEVTLVASDRAVCVVFDDDGPGIPEDERATVFEPFVRLETSRSRETGGSGLGLAIVKQIVDAHQGEIAVEAAPLGGARIRVSLPRSVTPV
ncbi:MAG: ATP-binding protein [Pseudomonadota bacterium]